MSWASSYISYIFLPPPKRTHQQGSGRRSFSCLSKYANHCWPYQNLLPFQLGWPPRGSRSNKSEDPHAIIGPEKRKNEREIVEDKEETALSQSCKRKRLTEVLKAPKPSPAKTDSCKLFHNRTQDRTKERENCTVLDLGISKDRGVSTQCSTGWSPQHILRWKNTTHRVINQTINLEEGTQRCHSAPVPKIAADTSTA